MLKLNPYSTDAMIAKNVIKIEGSAFNLIPFSTIKKYIVNNDNYNSSIIIKFFILNFIIYIPLAVLLSFNKIKENNRFNYSLIFLVPIIIELLQVIFEMGLFDIDSIILNILGMIITYELLKMKNVKKKGLFHN